MGETLAERSAQHLFREVPSWIREAREHQGLTLQEVARRARMTTQTVKRAEAGSCTLRGLWKLTVALGLEMTVRLDGTEGVGSYEVLAPPGWPGTDTDPGGSMGQR